MVSDGQVKELRRWLHLGKSLPASARIAEMDEKTARRFRDDQRLPSQRRPATSDYRTRIDPFGDVWAEVQRRLEAEPRLQAKTLFRWLQGRFPGQFPDSTRRTFERRVRLWRSTQGPGKAVMFPQVHHPGQIAASACRCDCPSMLILGEIARLHTTANGGCLRRRIARCTESTQVGPSRISACNHPVRAAANPSVLLPRAIPMGSVSQLPGSTDPFITDPVHYDDRLVMIGGGDEIRLRFQAPNPPPPGHKRDFILHLIGWDKDADLNTLAGQSVGPLPFQASDHTSGVRPREPIFLTPNASDAKIVNSSRRVHSNPNKRMHTKTTTRRSFIKSATLATVAAPSFAWTAKSFANDSKNDRPQIGCIGVGSMGTGDAKGHAGFGDIVAVCDVDSRHAERAQQDDGIGKGKADAYGDYRRVLDRNDIDVVSVVTPDHWHVKIAIEALEAGKHVFCQKPLTLTLEENQLIRKACQKHPDKVFFIGTQQRSDRDKFLRAVNLVQKGLLGDIKRVTVGIDGSPTGGPFPIVDPPSQLDWEMWLGQAPLVPFRHRRCHYEFRWWYEYSGGKFTDWGAHHVDIALWALNQNGEGQGPISIDGSDAKHPVPFERGYPLSDDQYNTSHDFAIKCLFANGIEMVIDSRSQNGVLFEGKKGRIFVNRGKITGTPIEENWDQDKFTNEDVQALYKGKPHEGHKHNFYRCIREGGLPVSDVYSHVQAMSTCHLAAIAARLGREIRWDPKSEKIVNDDEAATFFARDRREGYEILDLS